MERNAVGGRANIKRGLTRLARTRPTAAQDGVRLQAGRAPVRPQPHRLLLSAPWYSSTQLVACTYCTLSPEARIARQTLQVELAILTSITDHPLFLARPYQTFSFKINDGNILKQKKFF